MIFPSQPKRSLGQNFLVSTHFQNKIVEAVRACYRGQILVEIGPGRGALTEQFLTFAKRLIVIEKDDVFAETWRRRFLDKAGYQVRHMDALDWDFSDLREEEGALAVGNLPYNVATPLVLQLLAQRSKFSEVIVMIQKEVAEKCVATPGHKNFGPLSVACQLFSDIQKICDVPPQAFKPRPNVDSRVLMFVPKKNLDVDDAQDFLNFVKVLFSARRKVIQGLIEKSKYADGSHLLEPRTLRKRAEQMSVDELVGVYRQIKV